MLQAFTSGLSLITISELGDKTFFIAAILAMKHSRRLVFIGATVALAAMTLLSVLMGQTVALLPKVYVYYAEVILFIGFGLKLLYDASRLPAQPDGDEEQAALEAVKAAESKLPKEKTWFAICLEAFLLTFVAEWGDRTQFTTILLAATNNPIGITVGATLGHAICAAIAVVGGRLIAGRISERMVTATGGALFILFGAIAWMQGA